MGITFLEGFEDYADLTDLKTVYASSSTAGISSSIYRTGTRSLNLGYYTALVYTYPYDSLYMGCAVYHNSNWSFTTLLTMNPSHCKIEVNNGTKEFVYKDGASSTTNLGVYAPMQSWYYIEVYFERSVSGSPIVRINGSTVYSPTGVDCQYGTNYYTTGIIIGPLDYTFIDDFYIADDGFKGPLKVHTFVPDADGTYSNFTALGAGSHYAEVDETPGPDYNTSYVEGDTQGDKDSFGITTSGITGPIKAVGLRNWVSGVGDGATKVTPFVRSNSTDYSGDETGLLFSDYKGHTDIFDTDPDDSNPWTTTKLDNAEFGIEITSLSTTTTTV